jgi:hypothetical protein
MTVTEHDHHTHDHHTHDHHDHTHGSVEAPYVDEGPTDGPPDALVLDIGDDIGALVL